MKIGKFICFALMFWMITLAFPLTSSHAAMKSDKTTAADVKGETEVLLKTLKSYTIEQRDEAVRVTSAELEKIDKRIEALERKLDEQWADMDQAARQSARSNLKELHRQRNLVAEWYGGMKESTAQAWEKTKGGFSEAFQSLRKTWEKTEKDLSPQEKGSRPRPTASSEP